jgi:hypothetical protein
MLAITGRDRPYSSRGVTRSGATKNAANKASSGSASADPLVYRSLTS